MDMASLKVLIVNVNANRLSYFRKFEIGKSPVVHSSLGGKVTETAKFNANHCARAIRLTAEARYHKHIQSGVGCHDTVDKDQ